MKYMKNTETQTGTTFKVMMVSQEYINCKKDVDKLCLSIKKLMASIGSVLADVIADDTTGQLQEKYKHCLKHTIMIALDDVDKLIAKHHITSDEEMQTLKETITDLLDGVEELFNQG